MLYRIIVFIFLFISLTHARGQGNDSLLLDNNGNHLHIVKLDLLNINEFITNINKQLVGLEYEFVYSNRISFSLDADFGLFNRYEYYKYYQFFQNRKELPYTRTTMLTRGFHISPQVNFYLLSIQKKPATGLFVNGGLDYFWYKNNLNFYDSRNPSKSYDKDFCTSQLALGVGGGFQYIYRKRLAIVLSLDMYYKLFDFYDSSLVEMGSQNANWISENEKWWAIFKLKLGYAFGK